MSDQILILKYKTIVLATISCILTIVGLFTPFYTINRMGSIYNYFCFEQFVPAYPFATAFNTFESLQLQSWIMLIFMVIMTPIFATRIFVVDTNLKDIKIPLKIKHSDSSEEISRQKKRLSIPSLFDASENKKALPMFIKLHTALLLVFFFEFIYALYQNKLPMVYQFFYGFLPSDPESYQYDYASIGYILFVFAIIIEIFNVFMITPPRLVSANKDRGTGLINSKSSNTLEKYQEMENHLISPNSGKEVKVK